MMKKKKMKQLKVASSMMVASFFILTYLFYTNWNKITFGVHKPQSLILKPASTAGYMELPIRLAPKNKIFYNQKKHFLNESYNYKENELVNVLNTPGCRIPASTIDYEKNMKNNKKDTSSCGKRAVFLKKVGRDKVQALIKPRIIKKYLRKSAIFDCCYRFISTSHEARKTSKEKNIKFTKCIKFQDNVIITLETDFINVKCFDYDRRNISHSIYDDVYAFTKVINVRKRVQDNCKDKFNVLMIGIDTMSLPRFVQTLPRTFNYFKDNFWLGFRGYNKVEDNTFPNLMAVLTGRNLSDVSKMCSGKMDECRKLLIWDEFKKAGYVTAYGEDYLRLPDTFSKQYTFSMPPADHYLRPFFQKGETEYNKTLVCAGKLSSGQQLLNYALDFVNTYKNDHFFGLFWMNSFSHNANSKPQNADVMLENFFNQLGETGVLQNTFVIALSDHGIRFGEYRMKIESYYDERMPFLFVLPPKLFREKYALKYKSLAVNQFRLTTPYDLHHTLNDINEISTCTNTTAKILKSCPKCHSLFKIASANRTCQEVAIHNKWCSCHKLYSLPVQDTEGAKSVQTAVSHLNRAIKSVRTKRCWGCMTLSLRNVIRIHYYYHEDNVSLYYVVAFTMTPGFASYEATVLLKDGKRAIIGSLSLISPYGGFGTCTIIPKDRVFCLCQRIEKCW